MRKIGINLRAKSGLTDEEYIKTIKELGFDTVFSMVWGMEESLKTAELLAKAGLTYDTLHSPYKKINDMWSAGEAGGAMYASLTNGVDTCLAVGAPIMVVHLSSGLTPPPPTDVGRGRFIDLVDYAGKKGIKIAFENQRMLGNIGWAFEEFKDAEHVGFCWDCGHEACFTGGRQYMPLFGERLICTHIHDNDGLFNHDQHRLPFDGGGVNYDRFAKYIRESSYTGALMLEVEGDNDFYADITCEEFLRRAAEKIKKLRERVAPAGEAGTRLQVNN
ncbi:MAG: sugar phosphate isomerase/epimerase [Ruminococcaceae bacterium]|nr:sugar phosphate isomerase/epimerase [Oscillospiraceae bacterium]